MKRSFYTVVRKGPFLSQNSSSPKNYFPPNFVSSSNNSHSFPSESLLNDITLPPLCPHLVACSPRSAPLGVFPVTIQGSHDNVERSHDMMTNDRWGNWIGGSKTISHMADIENKLGDKIVVGGIYGPSGGEFYAKRKQTGIW